LKTKDKELAELKKKELEVNIWKGLYRENRKINLEDYFQEYLKAIRYRKVYTNQNEIYLIKKFLRGRIKKTLSGVRARDIWRFLLEYERKANRTFNHAVGAVKRFFQYAVRRGYLDHSPCQGMKFKKIPQALPRFFTHEEYLRIEKTAEGHNLYSMIVTARYTGLRLGELIHLEWEDFNWENRTLQVLNKKKFDHSVKNYRLRIIPISDEFYQKIKPFIQESGICFMPKRDHRHKRPYTAQGPKRTLKYILERAGVLNRKRMGWHEFRHTFASHLVQNNVPLYKVSRWLGHRSLNTTQIYANFAPLYDKDIEKLALVGQQHRIDEQMRYTVSEQKNKLEYVNV